MQFESKNCVFKNVSALPASPHLSLLIGFLCQKIGASQDGHISFDKGADFVAMPLLFMRNKEYREGFNQAVADCHKLGCDAVLVVGIGGSSLGASAVYEALGHGNGAPIYFLETVNPEQYADLEKLMHDGSAVHVVIVSKSGTTLETSINSSFAIDMLRKSRPDDWHYYVTIISDMESPLSEFAEKEEFRWLGIPEVVGGRFSVFSTAGLFPLALAGIDVREFCEGACQELERFAQKQIESDAVASAQALYAAHENGYWIHDTFLWDFSLEVLGKWYRQLTAESLGKRKSLSGQVVETGILPTVSIGTQDLHSMIQLYLGGPRKIVTTFVLPAYCSPIRVPSSGWGMAQYVGRDVASIRDAIIRGVQTAYVEDNRPFMTIVLDKTAAEFGRFMMMKMLEVVSLGALLEVSPFDQPEVEKYKKAAHQFLSQLR